MFPLLVVVKVPWGAGIPGGMVWYVSLTGCSEGPWGAGIQGEMIPYVSLTGCNRGAGIQGRIVCGMFPLPVVVEVPKELVFKVE